MKSEVIVSVCIRTYNQEKFVEEALDSVLSQRTEFPVEIIVSDDCSKDRTRVILADYQSRYPEQIRLIFGEDNVGGPNNLRRVIEASSAKYICCLDGDDFFTDAYKLQKQVDFLEDHPEFAACFHNTWNTAADGTKLSLFNTPGFHSVHDAREFIRERWFVPIHSAVLRREYIQFPGWYDTVMNDDYVVHLSVALHGPYYYMPDVMVAYRHHDAEISTSYCDISLINSQLCTILEGMKQLYPVEYASDFDARVGALRAEIYEWNKMQRQPWRKWLCVKTYKRIIKQNVKKLIGC